MTITHVEENKYYKWLFLASNSLCMTHVLIDKIKDTAYMVHATTYRFPIKKNADDTYSYLLVINT